MKVLVIEFCKVMKFLLYDRYLKIFKKSEVGFVYSSNQVIQSFNIMNGSLDVCNFSKKVRRKIIKRHI